MKQAKEIHDKSNAEVAKELYAVCVYDDHTWEFCEEQIERALTTAQSQLAREVLKETDATRITYPQSDAEDEIAYNFAIDDAVTSLRNLFSRLGIEVKE